MTSEVTAQALDPAKGIYGVGFEMGLEQLLKDTAVEDVVKKIKEYRGVVIAKMG